MDNELISVRDVAVEHGKRKQTVFKILKRLGIEARKQRCSTGKNQFAAYITEDEYQRLLPELLVIGNGTDSDNDDVESVNSAADAEQGVFYLVQLEPTLDPGRLKLGFASGLPERLRQLRCSAPFAVVLKSWQCRRLWEKTAIDCASIGCERLHTEVFRATSLDDVVRRCENFFAIMPPVQDANRLDAVISKVEGNGCIESVAAQR